MLINFITTSHKLDWVPVASTVKNLCDLYAKYAYRASEVGRQKSILSDDGSLSADFPFNEDSLTYSDYLLGKSNVRCTIGLLPVVGNVILFYSDTCASSIWEIIPVISTVKNIADLFFWTFFKERIEDNHFKYYDFLENKVGRMDYWGLVPILGNAIKLYRLNDELLLEKKREQDQKFLDETTEQIKNAETDEQFKELSLSLLEYPFIFAYSVLGAWDDILRNFPESLKADSAFILQLIERYANHCFPIGVDDFLVSGQIFDRNKMVFENYQSPVSENLLEDKKFIENVLTIIHQHIGKWEGPDLEEYPIIREKLIRKLSDEDQEVLPPVPDRVNEHLESRYEDS